MKNALVIADSGPIISLALIDKLDLLDLLFGDVKISNAVWNEISNDKSKPFHNRICSYFSNKVEFIKGFNDLTFIMDYGESESVILYKELQADFMLIDDKKARNIAENLGVNCVGTLGILITAKNNGLVKELKPLFEEFLNNHRFYSLDLINNLLTQSGEDFINI